MDDDASLAVMKAATRIDRGCSLTVIQLRRLPFPRSPERGLIEAIYRSTRISGRPSFPRSPERGLIEAKP